VVVLSQDSFLAKDGHLSKNNQVVSNPRLKVASPMYLPLDHRTTEPNSSSSSSSSRGSDNISKFSYKAHNNKDGVSPEMI